MHCMKSCNLKGKVEQENFAYILRYYCCEGGSPALLALIAKDPFCNY